MRKKKIDWLKLVISIAIPLLAGFIGSFFTSESVSTWYQTLIKPSFNPPNWIFGPVWTLLFILMGIALYLVWIKGWKKDEVKIGIYFFSAQMVLNLLWSYFFFYLHQPLYSFIEIIFLWLAIFGTILTFYKVDKRTLYLLLPYLLWVSFAAFLNLTIYLIN
ncbi:tryptophan-rich sensory protein [Candidatus Woesearchaeota archaeon]|nr:tryptophan-rich sensory protein [Candidatus Woesearchaeota archaeon]